MIDVAGLVAFEMEVQDIRGTCITRINSSTVGPPRHVVKVENIGKRPRGIRVLASLPGGVGRLEFVNGGQRTANWDKQVLNVPCNSPRELECDLSRKSAGLNEPLQCDKIYQARGASQNWKELRSTRIPRSIHINVG